MGRIPQRHRRALYLREWFEAFEIEPEDHDSIADAIGYSGSHLKNSIHGRRPNPSADFLVALSEFLAITVNDFYHPPAQRTVLRAMANLPPAAREILLRQK